MIWKRIWNWEHERDEQGSGDAKRKKIGFEMTDEERNVILYIQ